MAVAAATAQEESGGRFLLGCGVTHRGAVEALGLAYPASPLQHARDYLDELRRFSSAALAFGAGFPVLLGALGDRMLAVAAEHSDGVILNWLTEPAIIRMAAAFEAASPAPRRAGVMVLMRAGLRDALLGEASFYDSLPNYRAHFVRQGLRSAQEAVQETCMPPDGGVVAERLLRARAAGVTVPCLYPSGLSPDEICSLVADVGVHMAAATG
jgi:5,10-methylenetetrahydromethanopterin reductase